jgi:hypothetical protein
LVWRHAGIPPPGDLIGRARRCGRQPMQNPP